MCTNLLKASVVLALLAILLGMPLLFSSHQIRYWKFMRASGKTEAELEELFVAKAGKYDGYDQGWFSGENPKELKGAKIWCSRHGAIVVWFGDDGKSGPVLMGPSIPVSWWARFWHRIWPPKEMDVTPPASNARR
jgi:hypothetical protein